VANQSAGLDLVDQVAPQPSKVKCTPLLKVLVQSHRAARGLDAG
jgi:hypothetical protein